MALFNDVSSFGGPSGDIWASDTFSLTSPISDLLDKGNYTLTQLLDEDEVLQEVMSHNSKLIDFLSTDAAVSELVGFISDPINVNYTKEKRQKYSYIACEIFCCEVPSLLGVLAGPGGHLKQLFAVLNDPHNLYIRAVGYFGKVLMVLFKCTYDATIAWINDGGYNLFNTFRVCASSYSVVQILRRLLLPRNVALADFEQGTNYSTNGCNSLDLLGRGTDIPHLWCDWGSNEEILKALLSCITTSFCNDPTTFDIDGSAAVLCDENTRLNVAELLSSVICSSTDPQSSPVLRFMLLSSTIEMVIAAIMSSTIPGAGVAAATTYHEQQQQQQQQQQPDSSNFSTPSSSLTPLSVLNALLNHLVEHEKETAVLIGGLNSSLQKHSNDDAIYAEAVAAVFKAVPGLVSIISPPSCNNNEMDLIGTQNNKQIRRVGMVRLDAVKALSKLGVLASWDGITKGVRSPSSSSAASPVNEITSNPAAAELAFINGAGPITLLDAFQTYPHCSFLHEAVCKFVETVTLSSHSRGLQIHLLKDCRLLERLIEWGERKGSWPNNGHVQRMAVAVVLAQGYQRDKLVNEEVGLPLRDIVRELEDADPLQVEKWKMHVDTAILPKSALELAPLAGCTVLRGTGSADVPLHFPDSDSNMDDLVGIGVSNMLEDVLKLKEDRNSYVEEFPNTSRIWQDEEFELVTDFNKSLDFDGGGGGAAAQGSQTHSNSGSSLLGCTNFSAFGASEETTPPPPTIADFADFSEVMESNQSSSSSISNSPYTTTVMDRTNEPIVESETAEMASAVRTVPFDAKNVVTDPSEQQTG